VPGEADPAGFGEIAAQGEAGRLERLSKAQLHHRALSARAMWWGVTDLLRFEGS